MRSWVVVVALAAPGAAEAHLAVVDWSRIPTSDAVAACRDAAPRMEMLAGEWEPEWPHDAPREAVAADLIVCYDTIVALGAADPQNAELWLLRGVYAWYLHNLEQDGYAERVLPALVESSTLQPGLRAVWFEAAFLAQSARAPAAMRMYLSTLEWLGEEGHPGAFWWDYALAAYSAGMPANALRALDRAEAGGHPKEAVDELRGIARGAYYLDPATATAFEEGAVWYAEAGSVCNRVFAFCAALPPDWQVQLLQTGPDVSGLLLVPPAYPTPQGRVSGSILLLAANARDRTLDTFLYDGVKKRRRAHPIDAPALEGAVAIEVLDPRTYKRLGGAHAVKVAFARDRPRYPGLEGEAVVDRAPEPGGQVWRPVPRFDRVAGVVQYSVLLDIGELAHEPARADFDRFVAGITAEGAPVP